MSAEKWVYRFGEGLAEGDAAMTSALGNKGANLAEMARMGLPVPPGFILSTQACRDFFTHGHELRPKIREEVLAALEWLGDATGRHFGSAHAPLLVSVRSGAAVSMPGMMDTVLNIGLNEPAVAALAHNGGNERFVLDSYRRLIQMYGDVVLGVDAYAFEDILSDHLNLHGCTDETQIDSADMREIIAKFQSLIAEECGEDFPQDVMVQFFATISAVFRSWYSPRATSYRQIQCIDDDLGTAVTVQAMVFGNRSVLSCSGVAFTRDPSNGAPGLYGEYMPQAQGEDIVAGVRNPRALTESDRVRRGVREPSLQSYMPAQFRELAAVGADLEQRFRDMQDIEFTIDDGRLWLLQTRAGKRTIEAAIRIALDLLDESIITRVEAIERVSVEEFGRLVRPVIDPDFDPEVIARGLPASPGTAFGAVVFTPAAAVAEANNGKPVILVRNETCPDDVDGINAAAALLTRRGGMTSHAAVIARAMGRPCIVGTTAIRLDTNEGRMWVGEQLIREGDEITIDGGSGRVILGRVPMKEPQLGDYLLRFKALVEASPLPSASA